MEESLCLGGESVGLVRGFGLLSGLGLAIEVLESLQEAVGNAVLVVQVERTLRSLVANYVSVGKVLGDDTGTGLLLLGNLVAVLLTVGFVEFLGSLGAGYRDLGLSKLGVVQEKCCLGRGLFLENDFGVLGLRGGARGDFQGLDLSTE